MDVMEAIEKRRSIRHYRPESLPDTVLERLLNATRLAPSSGNRQPWRFVVVRDNPVKERLASVCSYRRLSGELQVQRFIAEAPVVVVACGSEQEANVFYRTGGLLAIAQGAALQGDVGRDATDAQSTLLVDLASALSHLMLAAMAEGVGTCWVMGIDERQVKEILAIPGDVRAPMLMTLGYPASWPEPRPRKPLEQIVCYERYGWH
jgi:nitroreductase